MADIIMPNQLEYLQSLRRDTDPLQTEMEEFAREHKVPILNRNAVEMLAVLIYVSRPKRVLEIGTAIGYSTIQIAKHLPADSVVDTIELSRDNCIRCKDFFSRSGVEDKINLIEGDALQLMPEMEEHYDFIFLDADKEDYQQLFDMSMPLLNKGGLFFIDNLLWHGHAAADEVPDDYKVSTEYIREFNKMFMAHPELETTIVPVGDGVGLGVRRERK